LKVLLDTNVFLWWITKDPRIPDTASKIIANENNELYLSVASCWEMIIKIQLGKLKIIDRPELFFPEHMSINNIKGLPIQISHALHLYKLPMHHRDPFDRIIIAQSQVEKLPLIANDAMFKKYNVKTVWD